MSATQPPFVVLEHLVVRGEDLVRVVGWTSDESEAHSLTSAMAAAGLRVWLVDLWGSDGAPTISRYPSSAAVLWLHDQGTDASSIGAGDDATRAGL